MYVIIIGGGEIGRFIAEVLIGEAHEVVIVEAKDEVANRLEGLDASVVLGSGVSPPILRRAGIERADLFLAVTPVDEVNLVACMIAKKHGPASLRTVAKVKQSHYVAGAGAAFDADDLDAVDALVHTERAIASIAMDMLRYAGSGELREVAGGRLLLVGMLLGPDSPFVGGTLAEIREDLPKECLVVAVQHNDGVRIPTGTDRLAVDERAYVLTLPKNLTELTILSGQPWYRAHRILLIGIGNTGLTLAHDLVAKGFVPTLLEQDHARAELVASRLPKAMVLHGDAADPDFLRRVIEEQHIDAVVVLLHDPERSLLLGIFAKSLGAKKVLVRCDKPEYAHLAYKLGIDAIISKKRAVANAVLRYVSRGRVESTLMLGGEDDAELIAFRVSDAPARAELTTRPLRELVLPEGSLVGAVVRDGEAIIATGDTVIRPRDEVFVVCRPEAIAKFETLLA